MKRYAISNHYTTHGFGMMVESLDGDYVRYDDPAIRAAIEAMGLVSDAVSVGVGGCSIDQAKEIVNAVVKLRAALAGLKDEA